MYTVNNVTASKIFEVTLSFASLLYEMPFFKGPKTTFGPYNPFQFSFSWQYLKFLKQLLILITHVVSCSLTFDSLGRKSWCQNEGGSLSENWIANHSRQTSFISFEHNGLWLHTLAPIQVYDIMDPISSKKNVFSRKGKKLEWSAGTADSKNQRWFGIALLGTNLIGMVKSLMLLLNNCWLIKLIKTRAISTILDFHGSGLYSFWVLILQLYHLHT